MVTLDYKLAEDELAKLASFNFAELTLTDLDYYLFCGDVFFRIDGVDFDTPWGWIPLLNHCVRMCLVTMELRNDGRAVLEFTENEATISFELQGNQVAIAASFVDASASVSIQELREAVTAFSEKLLRELVMRWPALTGTAAFQERVQLVQAECGARL